MFEKCGKLGENVGREDVKNEGKIKARKIKNVGKNQSW
jgi:hypothetical protein